MTTEAEIEAALDVWFTRPDWRDVYADGPPVRDYMRRALDAAAEIRRAVEQRSEAETPWSRSQTSARAGLCMCGACVSARGEWQVTMHLCPMCGNKRCPKAEDHRFKCFGSNKVGQVGELECAP